MSFIEKKIFFSVAYIILRSIAGEKLPNTETIGDDAANLAKKIRIMFKEYFK